MAVGQVAGGMLQAFSDYLTKERTTRRKSEDDAITEQQEIIKALMERPDINPALLGKQLQAYLELSNQKAGTRKRKPGMEGFLGGTESPISSFLQAVQDGTQPMVGRTTEEVPQGGMEHMVPEMVQPLDSRQIPGRSFMDPVGGIQPEPMASLSEGFTGETVMSTPVMVPPTPLANPPNSISKRLISAANTLKTTRPVANQPLLIHPDELAERAGKSAGILKLNQELGSMDARRQTGAALGISDDRMAEVMIRDWEGASANTFRGDTTPQIYVMPDGTRIEGYQKFNQADGSLTVIDRYGNPIPDEAQPATTSTSQDPTSRKEYLDVVADEEARGIKGGWKDRGYDAWLTWDANRKKSTSTTNNIIGNSGMNAREVAVFNQIAQAYQTSPLMRAKDRTITLKQTAQRLKGNPGDPAAQLALSYAFVQALDTYQSAVREGELKNIGLIDSRIGQLINWGQQMISGQLQRPEVALQIVSVAEMLSDAIQMGADMKQIEYASRANVSGVGDAWKEFIQGAGTLPTAPNTNTPNPNTVVPPPPGGTPRTSLEGYRRPQ